MICVDYFQSIRSVLVTNRITFIWLKRHFKKDFDMKVALDKEIQRIDTLLMVKKCVCSIEPEDVK